MKNPKIFLPSSKGQTNKKAKLEKNSKDLLKTESQARSCGMNN